MPRWCSKPVRGAAERPEHVDVGELGCEGHGGGGVGGAAVEAGAGQDGAGQHVGNGFHTLFILEAMSHGSTVEDQAEKLREELRHHEHLYYVMDAPVLTDAQYDALMNKLKALEADHPELVTADSPTQRVGGKPADGFKKVGHSRPMLSLDNAYNEEDLRAWDVRVKGGLADPGALQYTCELKLDGLSLALHYGPGKGGAVLERGLTRGDGTTGEDVTTNVRTIKSVPIFIPQAKLEAAGLPASFEVRGECVMPLAAFKKMNAEQEAAGLAAKANPRNAAAGNDSDAGAKHCGAAEAGLLCVLSAEGRGWGDAAGFAVRGVEGAGARGDAGESAGGDGGFDRWGD